MGLNLGCARVVQSQGEKVGLGHRYGHCGGGLIGPLGPFVDLMG